MAALPDRLSALVQTMAQPGGDTPAMIAFDDQGSRLTWELGSVFISEHMLAVADLNSL